MEVLNHDLTQGSRLGDINERREEKKATTLPCLCMLWCTTGS